MIRSVLNATRQDIEQTGGTRIVFVHVGKCAGESLVNSVGSALSDDFTMFRMHVYNANLLIRDLIENGPRDLVYLIATRDPIQRFVSAYNWDKHNMVLAAQAPNPQQVRYYEEFPSADLLARSLTDTCPEKAARAVDFARLSYSHMYLGQAWYTPPDLLPRLPRDNTFICDSSTYAEDLRAFVSALGGSGEPVRVFRQKGDYTAQYQNSAALFSKGLSPEGHRNLRVLLSEDIRVWKKLRQLPLSRTVSQRLAEPVS